MIRKTLIGLAAAAALTGIAASSASAGVKIHIGAPYFGGYYGAYYGGYYAPYYGGYNCTKVFVGWKKFWNGYHWVKKPIYKKHCFYGY
jgi:hypothetical protein